MSNPTVKFIINQQKVAHYSKDIPPNSQIPKDD